MPLSQDTVEKLILLVVTTLIGSLVVPFILKRIEQRRTEEQRYKEALLSRQEKFLDSQSSFVNTLEELLWQWRYLCVRVTYYIKPEEDKYTVVRSEYNEKVWVLMQGVRVQVSRARRLVSGDCYRQLLAFYHEMVALDKQFQLVSEMNTEKQPLAYVQLNGKICNEVSDHIDRVLNELAYAIHLHAMELGTASSLNEVRGYTR